MYLLPRSWEIQREGLQTPFSSKRQCQLGLGSVLASFSSWGGSPWPLESSLVAGMRNAPDFRPTDP